MTTDLWMLLASCALALLLTVPLASAMRRQWGIAAMIGNRENLPKLKAWGGRTERAYRNLLDNIILFGAVVCAAQIAGASNEVTALGAIVFFVSRVVHAAAYIAGVSYLRTLAWFGGVVGMGVIVSQLF